MMKALKYILIFLLILFIVFLAIGFIQPTVNYGHEIIVDKPIQETWAVTQDPDKYDLWLKGFQSIELIDGLEGEVGSKYKVIVLPQEGAEPFEMIETVVSIKEFDHVTLHFDSDFMDFEQTIYHSEKDGKTSVRSDSKVKAKNFIMRSMFATMEALTKSFTKQEAENFENLKIAIEENTKNYYPVPEMDVDSTLIEEIIE